MQKKARDKKIKELSAKAEAGGVKGMAAKNELIILEQVLSLARNATLLCSASIPRVFISCFESTYPRAVMKHTSSVYRLSLVSSF